MNLNKKAVIILTIFVSVLILGISIIIAKGIANPKEMETNLTEQVNETDKDTDVELSEQEKDTISDTSREHTYHNLDGLYFIPSKDYDNLKTMIEQYLKKEKYHVTHISITDRIETEDENFYTFWFLLDNDILIRGNFNYDLNEYAFMEETNEEIISKFIDNSTPETPGNIPDEYVYTELTIENMETLKNLLPQEAYERLSDELIFFLNSQNELRRLFTVNDIKEENTSIEWTFTFDTPRIDGKNIHTVYSENTFKFSIESQEVNE